MIPVFVAVFATPISIIPRPVQINSGSGVFEITQDTHIVAAREIREQADQLRNYLRPATGFDLEIIGHGIKNSINLVLDRKLQKLGAEGYDISVSADHIDVKAFARTGLFNGFQTLRQLLPNAVFRKARVAEQRWVVPSVHVTDQPRFKWRGAMMDCSRHFFPKEAVLRFLDEMALHKLNRFHWHLTDDQGWRIEIKRFPKLTEIGGWQPMPFPDYDPPKNPLKGHGGFYTQEDVREVVAYAAARNITVVPEIEMPGHSAAIIAAYPEVGTGNSNVLNASDETISMLKRILDEVIALFPSTYIHIGGDEVDKGPWKNDPASQAKMKSMGLKDEEELQSWIIRQIDAYLTSKGRRAIGWDEILQGGLAQGATVMSWRGMNGGITAAKALHDVVMAPTTYTYLDYLQGPKESEPRGIGGFLPLEKVYSMEPIPDALNEEEGRRILGVQGQLWAEYIPNFKHLEYMAWPRLAAIAEIGWSPKEGKSYDDFLTRLNSHLDRFKVLDINFRPLGDAPSK